MHVYVFGKVVIDLLSCRVYIRTNILLSKCLANEALSYCLKMFV